MIVYATYLDWVERCGYQPKLITQNWLNCDRRIICCSEMSVDVLKAQRTDSEILDIGLGISVPSDIPKAFNKSLDVIFEGLGEDDWLVFAYGDMVITPECDTFIYNSIQSHSGGFGCIPATRVSLYTYMSVRNTQLTINSYHCRARHDPTADGDQMTVHPPAWTNDLSLLLDIGYLGLPQYYAHTRNHINIWKNDGFKDKFLKLYEAGNRARCADMAYKSIRAWAGTGLQEINKNTYESLINSLNLQEDYEFCMKIQERYRS